MMSPLPLVIAPRSRRVRSVTGLLVILLLSSVVGWGQPLPDNAANEVYQYFVPGPEGKNSGAYLWVPPDAPVIRAVMVGIHNGLPITILQNAAVRKVCTEFGIAQILLTPNGSDIGGKGMLKDLNFDVTDPARTAIYDRYLKALADLSSHPELTLAPVIPLAHSAYASFPFDVAMRDASRCLMAMPIKAGLPDTYAFYGGGKSMTPAPDLNMAHVPILFINSHNQVTVPGRWKGEAIPYGPVSALGYRKADTDANPGDTYQKGNELFGECWEMLSCHFDMLPRNYEFVARYIATVCQLRLPATPPPVGEKAVLKPLTLNSGWLIDVNYQNFGQEGKPYFEPAPYAQYKGPKNRALWYPSEELARTTQQLMVKEYAKKFEMFTLINRKGEPIPLAESPQVDLSLTDYLEKDGLLPLRIHSFTEPFLVCTSKVKDHEKDPAAEHPLVNVAFPGKTTLPVSTLPLRVNLNASPVEQVPGPEFTLKLKPHRLAPDPGGYNHFYIQFYKEGNEEFAATGRNVKITGWSNGQKIPGIKDQKIDFPALTDQPKSTTRLKLAATSSAGLPVGYFVREGPAVIEGEELVITQLPAKDPKPIKITIGAYQVGLWQNEGFKAAGTVYQSFSLTP